MRGEKKHGQCARREVYCLHYFLEVVKKDIEISECSYYTDAIKN